MEKDNELNKLLQDTFSDFRVQADEEVWTNIEAELREAKKRRAAWWYYAAAASILALIATGALYLASEQEQPQYVSVPGALPGFADDRENLYQDPSSTPTQENRLATAPEALPSAAMKAEETQMMQEELAAASNSNKTLKAESESEMKDETLVEQQTTVPFTEQEAVAITEKPLIQQQKETAVLADSSSGLPEAANTEVAQINEPLVPKKATFKGYNSAADSAMVAEKIITPEDIDPGIPYEEEELPKSSHSRWYLAANMQSNEGTEIASNSKAFAKAVNFDREGLGNFTPTTSGLSPEENILKNGKLNGKRNYSPPLMASATVNYALSKQWSLETGLSYSLLSSSLQTEDSLTLQVRQTEQLHYIGIPLLLNFNYFASKKIILFVSAGGVINKGISHVTRISLETEEKNSSTQRSGIDGIKYTVYAGIGIEYRFIPRMGIFLQPGMSYYAATEPQPFDIGGASSSGTRPDIRFGLRFHLKPNEQ